MAGIGPVPPPWQGGILPLNYIYIGPEDGLRTRNSHLGRVELYQLSYFRIGRVVLISVF